MREFESGTHRRWRSVWMRGLSGSLLVLLRIASASFDVGLEGRQDELEGCLVRHREGVVLQDSCSLLVTPMERDTVVHDTQGHPSSWFHNEHLHFIHIEF